MKKLEDDDFVTKKNEKGSESQLASAELIDKCLASTSIGRLEGSKSMLYASAELLDKSIASTSINGLEGKI
ncbi:hypothetical protein MTR67_024094 [Solanum verrucosum]|uniref:Uncharacterized protein n=1 Tax=Solanum verrucosum TaxID=315347 RepID=A0AAF0R364_SOLVR|nr:hypothetical protein MTR67_024094 [Solanum verrucosum]